MKPHVGHQPFFFTDDTIESGAEPTILGIDARHLRVVRRARVGDAVRISDGRGTVGDAHITDVASSSVRLEVSEVHHVARPSPRLEVFQALPKGLKLDFTIQKLVEVGTDSITIYLAERSVPRWDASRGRRAGERWEAVAREAAKQAHRAWLPNVRGPVEFQEAKTLLSEHPARLVLDPSSSARLHDALSHSIDSIGLVVGPEGGLAAREMEDLEGTGLRVSMGPQIMRTETAALAASCIILFHYGALG